MSQNSYKDLIAWQKGMELELSGLVNSLKERERTQDSRLGTQD